MKTFLAFLYGLATGVSVSVVAYLLRSWIKSWFVSDLRKVEEKLNQK